MKPLVPNPNNIRLATLGMVDGNGHPYSWSAIIGGIRSREESGRMVMLDEIG